MGGFQISRQDNLKRLPEARVTHELSVTVPEAQVASRYRADADGYCSEKLHSLCGHSQVSIFRE